MYFKHNTTGKAIHSNVYDHLTEKEKNNYSPDYSIQSNEDVVFEQEDEMRVDILTGTNRKYETFDCPDMD